MTHHADIERQIEFDFLRATEIAALNTLQWLGKGQKELADAAACDAIRGMFDLVEMCGEIAIGEGIKDEAPGLFKGEKVGTWRAGAPRFEIALDPIDGTTNVAKGMPNSLSCIAAGLVTDGTPCLLDVPAFYMQKLAYPLEVRKAWVADPKLPIDIDAPVGEVIDVTAKILGKEVRDVVVSILDRPRNEPFIDEVRRKGAALRLIQDGDIAAALAPAMARTSSIDLYVGIGGAPEAVLSAAGLRCLGGGMRAKIWPRDEAERTHLEAIGWGDRLGTQFMSRDLARGDHIVFAATGISTGPLLEGVEVRGTIATTHSLIMRARSGTVRFVAAHHDLDRKTIHLRSTQAERRV